MSKPALKVVETFQDRHFNAARMMHLTLPMTGNLSVTPASD